jgi:hypothetical protein
MFSRELGHFLKEFFADGHSAEGKKRGVIWFGLSEGEGRKGKGRELGGGLRKVSRKDAEKSGSRRRHRAGFSPAYPRRCMIRVLGWGSFVNKSAIPHVFRISACRTGVEAGWERATEDR